jgi:hypothetical protein
MSTRSMIFVTGYKQHESDLTTFSVYKHHDGYPTHTLALIADTLFICDKLIKAAKPFAKLNLSTFLGKLTGEGTNEYGQGVSVEKESRGDYGDHLINHGDLDYVYIINLVEKTVHCMKKEGSKFGSTNPFDYLNKIAEQYRKEDQIVLTKKIERMKKLGFKIFLPI